jgi:hypothetical protein
VREAEEKPIDSSLFEQQFPTSRLLSEHGGSTSWMSI